MSSAAKSLRERLSDGTEDKLGKALTDLLENPVLTSVIGHAFDARERAAQAQEVAMGALNLPSAADIERLTRRLRSVSQRLEGIEDGVHRLDRALTGRGVESRLSAIEDQLGTLTQKLGKAAKRGPAQTAASKPKPAAASKPGPARASKPASAPKTAQTARSTARRPTKAGAKAKPKKA
ncbi:MAG TPA: hypothetical protein VII53_07935 [Solirubrobacteraceae bacterium]